MKQRIQLTIIIATLLISINNFSIVFAQKDSVKLQEFKVCQSSAKRQLTENENNSDPQILLPMTNTLNIHYDTELYFGKNKQPFKLLIDTGSTALWIPDQGCTNCKQNNLWKLYNCDTSNTCKAKDKEKTVRVEYGVGSIDGYSVKDEIYLSDKDQTGIEYDFLLVKSVNDFKVLQIQGILGLGREIRDEFSDTILGIMKSKGVINQKVFSLYLSDSSCLGNSALVFGGYNEDYTDSAVSYIKVNTDELWSVEIHSASLVSPNKEKGVSTPQKEEVQFYTNTVVIDSGTTKVVLPLQDLETFVKVLKEKFSIMCDLEKRSSSAEILTVVCSESDISKYPSFQFTLGSTESERKIFELTSEDYIETCFYNLQVRKCALRFQNVDTPYILLGDTFLRKYYTVFDMEKDRIGFALAKNSQPKRFYEMNIFSAYILLGLVIGTLSFFLLSCRFYQMYQDHLFEKNKQFDMANNTAGADQGGNQEMQQGPYDQSLENSNDVSEEVSQDDISEIDVSQSKNSQSYRLPLPQQK